MPQYSIIGKPLPNVDGVPKATGEAKYVEDISLPGMLHGKILRSPYPHALIRHMDTTQAKRLPGVKALVTAADTPKIKYIMMGPPYQDRLPLADDKVRFIGEEVAAVAASDEEIAREALELIRVEYEEIPAVFDPQEAMAPGAPQIHHVENNVAARFLRQYGDVEEGFRDSDYIFEDSFTTQAQAHGCLERHGTVASFDRSGNLTIWTSTQSVYMVRKEVSNALDIPPGKIRVMDLYCAGSFGARSKICTDEALCALLARMAGKPVRIALTRPEEFTTTRVRHPASITLRTGVKKDGTLLAKYGRVIVDNGAYNDQGPAITTKMGSLMASLYRAPHVMYEGYTVYTNKQPGGAFRGFGSPQMAFAMESQLDMIAERLGIDAVELRRRNSNHPNETTSCGYKITTCGLEECIKAAAEHIGWDELRGNRNTNRGVGMASAMHVSGARVSPDGDYSSAIVCVAADGSVTLYCGVTDFGQWAKTTLIQIAAEELGARFEDVRILTMDTETTPVELGSYASRGAFVIGNAVKVAANDAREQLFEAAADMLEANRQDLVAADGKIFVAGNPDHSLSFGKLVWASSKKVGHAIYGKGHYFTPTELPDRETGYGNPSAAYSFGTQAVEVEVDRDTGEVRVLRCVAAHDVGQALNPMAVQAQIEGSVSQGMGFALTENYVYAEGKAVISGYADYKMPTAPDMPRVDTVLIETDDRLGPFGAKSVGETGMIPTAAAIANAVYDAVGVRIKNLPITAEAVVAALRQKEAEDGLNQGG